MYRIPTLCLALLWVAACNSTPDVLRNTRWTPVKIGGLPVLDGSRATLEFAPDERVSGNGGCNRYGGSAKFDDYSLQFGALAATRMACLDAGAMDQEDRLFAAFEATHSFRKEGDELVLLDVEGKETIRLKPL